MSRTIRRKNVKLPEYAYRKLFRGTQEIDFNLFDSTTVLNYGSIYFEVFYKKDSKQYKKIKAFHHTDAGTISFKEPGPMWYIREFMQVPYRVKCKKELHRFARNEIDDVVLESKPKKKYWT